MQGLSERDLPKSHEEPESLLKDFAGNAFSAPVAMCALLTLVSQIPFESVSDAEEMAEIQTRFQLDKLR